MTSVLFLNHFVHDVLDLVLRATIYHYKSNEVFLISANNGNKRRNLMQYKILFQRSLPSVT